MSDAGPDGAVGEGQALALAAAFLRQFWQDERAPRAVYAKDAFGQPVWRFITRQRDGRDGLDGVLTVDVDRRGGYVCGVRFDPAAG